MAYDTYVTVPNDLVVKFAGAITMDATTFSASWADTAVGDAGTWEIAQITLSGDAVGELEGYAYRVTVPEGEPFDRIIANGMIVPERATLSLLAVGALALSVRRGRSSCRSVQQTP